MATNRLLRGALLVMVSSGLVLCGSSFAQVPYGDGQKKIQAKTVKTTTTKTAPAIPEVTAEDLRNLLKAGNASNLYAGRDYRNFVVGYAIVAGKISFVDGTKNYERISWLEQILAEHGVQATANKKETVTGNIFNRVKTMTYTADVKGRDFVLESIIGYYGGSVGQRSVAPTAPSDPKMADVVATELKNKDIELELLRYAYEVDKLIQARQKLGAFDFSAKKANEAAMKDLKESKIPGAKSRLAANQSAVVNRVLDLGDNEQERKRYAEAIGMYDLSRANTDRVNFNEGNCYKALGDYDTAIKKYSAMSSSRQEDALNGIADCQHAKGNDREALKNLVGVLSGFHNTQAELDALAKVEKWGYLAKPADYPELAGQISGVYVEKALLNNKTNQDLAVKDFQKAVEVRAAGGNKASASKAILGEYAAAVSSNQTALTNSRRAAEQQFNSERQQAYTSLTRAQSNYERAVSTARTDYDYDLDRKRRDLNDSKLELERLMRNPPSNGGSTTDPYPTKPSGSNTDPYSTKPSSGSTTDPYPAKTSGSKTTDPYPSKPSSGSTTDPYPTSGGSTTDPYPNSGYQDSLAAAKARVERLDREYRYLYANETSYVEERTQTEARAIKDAKATYNRYDLSNQESYINNSADVVRYNRAVAQAQATYQTVGNLARTSGY